MKTAFLMTSVSRHGGGVTEVARQLAQHLSRTTNVNVQTFGLQDECTGTDSEAWMPLPVRACKVVGPRGFGYAPTLLSVVKQARADLLHCHGLWMYPSLVGLRAASPALPYMISPHGMLDPWAMRHSAWRKRLVAALFQHAHLRHAGCLHALSLSELMTMRALGFRNPMCVVPNGVALPARRGQERSDNTPSQAHPGQRTLLHLGRIHPKKGLSELLDAWALTRKRAPHLADGWVLEIAGWAGQQGYQSALWEKINTLMIHDSVSFVGPKYGDDKIATLHAADAFVLASVSEGMPMAVLEAWAHELPVLMTPQCNLPEGFVAGAAIRIDADAASIADGLQTLFSMSDSDRRTLGQHGRALVERRFTWDRAAAQFAAVYHWLIGDGPRPECVEQQAMKAAQRPFSSGHSSPHTSWQATSRMATTNSTLSTSPSAVLQDGRGQPNPYSPIERLQRVLWTCCYWLAFRPVPRFLNNWHRTLLRIFGAKIGLGVSIYPSAVIECPWNLDLAYFCMIGPGVRLYALGRIAIGEHTVISHRAYICAGSHDYCDPRMPLTRQAITIGNGVWICTEAFVGPGSIIGDRAVIGARSVVVGEMPSDMVCAGNPCRAIKRRLIRTV